MITKLLLQIAAVLIGLAALPFIAANAPWWALLLVCISNALLWLNALIEGLTHD